MSGPAPAPGRRWPAAAEALLALLVALLAMQVSHLAERPLPHAFSFGLTYQAMADDPFAWRGLFPHRVLLPLLAHLGGLTGERFHLAAHGSALLWLWLVPLAARRLGASWPDAALVALAAACGGANQLYKSHVGYPDSLCFALLLAALLQLRRRGACHALWLLAALAHEQAWFFAPLLLWLRRHVAGARWTGELLALGASLLAYAAFRVHVAAHAEPVAVAPEYYFQNGYFPLGFLGVLYLAAVHTVLVFGTMLPVLGWAAAGAPPWQRRALWLLLGGIVGVYLVAHDFNRFVNFLFLPLLAAGVRFLDRPMRRLAWLALVGGQLAVTAYVAMPVTQRFVAPMVECNCLTGVPRDLQLLVTYVLPRVWPWVLAGIALLVAAVAAGWAAGRRAGRAA